MRIDAKPLEVIALPSPTEDEWWTIAGLAIGLAIAIIKACNWRRWGLRGRSDDGRIPIRATQRLHQRRRSADRRISMARLIDCRVGPSSIVDLRPVRVERDGDDYAIGRHGARS